jgi:hypothetical protein
VVPADGRNRYIINGAWNWVEDDVEQNQQDDPANPHALLFMPTIHDKAPFMAAAVFSPQLPCGSRWWFTYTPFLIASLFL